MERAWVAEAGVRSMHGVLGVPGDKGIMVGKQVWRLKGTITFSSARAERTWRRDKVVPPWSPLAPLALSGAVSSLSMYTEGYRRWTMTSIAGAGPPRVGMVMVMVMGMKNWMGIGVEMGTGLDVLGWVGCVCFGNPDRTLKAFLLLLLLGQYLFSYRALYYSMHYTTPLNFHYPFYESLFSIHKHPVPFSLKLSPLFSVLFFILCLLFAWYSFFPAHAAAHTAAIELHCPMMGYGLIHKPCLLSTLTADTLGPNVCIPL